MQPRPAIDARAILARSDLFSSLAPADLDRVLEIARPRSAETGETLVATGDPAEHVFALLEGRVRVVSLSEEGREVVLRILQPGEVFGELGLLQGGTRTATVVASEPCRLLVLERRAFLRLLEANPRLSIQLLAALARRIQQLTDQISDFVFLGLGPRLAKKLLELARIYGRPADGGLRIESAISQGALAEFVGSSRESVNKQLKAWESLGWIRQERAGLLLLRADALEAAARGHAS